MPPDANNEREWTKNILRIIKYFYFCFPGKCKIVSFISSELLVLISISDEIMYAAILLCQTSL